MAANKVDLGQPIKNIQSLLITAGVIAGIGIVGFLVWKGIKKHKDTKDGKKEVDEAKDELNKLVVAGKKPTLAPTQITGIANTLFNAMDGPGTDEDAIIHEFAKINNDADMLSIIKAYGVRDGLTLQTDLKDELNSEHITALNGMLARKGIKYRL